MFIQILHIHTYICTCKLRKLWPYVAPCANEYAKEEKEEKNMTILAINHGELLATIGDYLLNNILN